MVLETRKYVLKQLLLYHCRPIKALTHTQIPDPGTGPSIDMRHCVATAP